MVLGRLRTKKRKDTVTLDYLIHVKQINPWHQSLTQKSADSVLLQWEGGIKSSGSFTSDILDEKIEFNESFRLPVTLTKESSKKGTTGESFEKNCLEFYLYECRKEKATKQIGSSTINLSEYGIIEETVAISAPVILKKSSKSSVQPVLYVNIQSIDKDSSGSSPKGNLPKETSLNGEENDDDEIAYFTDDDDASVHSSQTTSSTFEAATHPNEKKRTEPVHDGKETVNVEPDLPSRAALPISGENTAAEPGNYQNYSEVQNRTESEKDNKRTVHMESVLPQRASYENSDTNKSELRNKTKSAMDGTKTVNMEPAVSSGAAFANPEKDPVTESFKHQNNSKTQNTSESAKDSIEAPNMEATLLLGAASVPSNENPVEEALKFQNKSKSQYRAESARDSTDIIHVEPAPRLGVAYSDVDKVLEAEPLEYQNNSSFPQSSVDMTSFRKIVERRKKAADGNAIVRKAAQQFRRDNGTVSQAAKKASSFTSAEAGVNSDTGSSSESQIIQEDDTRARRYSIDSQVGTTSSLGIDLPENKKELELQKNGQDKQEMEVKEYFPDDEPISELSLSTRKEVSSRTKTLTSSKNADQGGLVPNSNLKTAKSRPSPLDSAKSNGPSRNKELRVGSRGNGIPEDTRNGSKSPAIAEIKGMKNDYSDSKDGLKSENEMLKEELKEAAAVEVALYSVVAEHGNSANKVHAPARRLSRFYFHACKAGSRSKMAGAARTSISGLILVSRACGNDVPRLAFWLSNSIVLRATVCQASANLVSSAKSDIGNDKFSPRRHKSFHEKKKNNAMECFEDWENIHTFIAALEKVEAWIFSRIIESVWWQTLTPYMQSAAAKNSSSRKAHGNKHAFGDPEQVNFSIDLWKKAFKDACERLCPLRAGGLQCGCLPVLARLVMEQLVNRLDVAMFNAILRDSAEDMPTDPLSDPISDPKVLPVPAGKTSFGAGAQLKNSIGNWSRWLTDLFGIDDDPSEDDNEPNADNTSECGTSFKPFYLLKSLSDLLMLPFDLLADGAMRQEVCPSFGAQLIKRVLTSFVPDEFCPDQVPESVFEVLDSEGFNEEGKEYITSVPCSAAPIVYSPPKAASLKCIIGEVGGHSPSLSRGASLLRKAYTSDDELDELDSPIKSISIDNIRVNTSTPTPEPMSNGKGHQKALRYQLLREVWKDEN